MCPSTILLTAMTTNNVQLVVFVMTTVAEMAARWNVSFSSFYQMRFTEQDRRGFRVGATGAKAPGLSKWRPRAPKRRAGAIKHFQAPKVPANLVKSSFYSPRKR